MHIRLSELVDDLTRQRADLLAAVASVPAEQLERRPAPDGWSVAEVLDHLQKVEGGTARLLARRLARAREAGVGGETRTDSVRDRMDQFAIATSPERRVAPEMVHPRHDVTAEEALRGIAESREALLEVLGDADGVDLTRVTAVHGIFGELDGYQWVLWIGQHEARHTRQIERLRAALAATPVELPRDAAE